MMALTRYFIHLDGIYQSGHLAKLNPAALNRSRTERRYTREFPWPTVVNSMIRLYSVGAKSRATSRKNLADSSGGVGLM